MSNHIYSIYKNIGEQFEVTIPIFTKGLQENSKGVYITRPDLGDQVLLELSKNGIDTRNCLDTGMLEILDSSSVYLNSENKLDSSRVISNFSTMEANAKSAGYDNLVVAGELPFVNDTIIDIQTLSDYEFKTDKYLDTSNIIAVCSYDEKKYSESDLAAIIKSHQKVAIYGKTYENKYFYTYPDYQGKNNEIFDSEDYKVIVSMIIEG